MALLSERGLAGFLLLGALGCALALGAWARVRRGPAHPPALTDLTLIATLIVVAVIGSFDAVLLLPVPSFFAWVIVGALASSARPVRQPVLTSSSHRTALLCVGLLGTSS